MTRTRSGDVDGVEDDALQERLDLARQQVAEQREKLRDARRRLRELEAASSARADRATTQVLRSKGHPSPEPPIPTYPPDWLGDAAPD